MQKFIQMKVTLRVHITTVDSFHSLYFLLNVGTCIKKEDTFFVYLTVDNTLLTKN